MANPTIGYDRFGSFVEWYRDDDDNSGQGDNPQTSRWYGTTLELRERAAQPPPEEGWVNVGSDRGSPPYDAATATGMYDHDF